jgi:hypothetical protein
MATLRTAALNLLRLSGFQSIRAGMQPVMHDITALLAMAMRQPPAQDRVDTLNQPWARRASMENPIALAICQVPSPSNAYNRLRT